MHPAILAVAGRGCGGCDTCLLWSLCAFVGVFRYTHSCFGRDHGDPVCADDLLYGDDLYAAQDGAALEFCADTAQVHALCVGLACDGGDPANTRVRVSGRVVHRSDPALAARG